MTEKSINFTFKLKVERLLALMGTLKLTLLWEGFPTPTPSTECAMLHTRTCVSVAQRRIIARMSDQNELQILALGYLKRQELPSP